MSQFNEIIAAESFQRRLARVRSAIDLLTEPARSEFATLVAEIQQQYELWQGSDVKSRQLTDELLLIATCVAFELAVWQSDIGPQIPEEDSRGESYRRLDCPATIEPHHRLIRPNLPEADASAENA